MRIYISGPMTGYKEYNQEAFQEAEEFIRKLGHIPINPHKIVRTDISNELEKFVDKWQVNEEDIEWLRYLCEDMFQIASCQTIYMLKDWDKSHGSIAELAVANRLGLQVIFEDLQAEIEAKFEEVGDWLDNQFEEEEGAV